MRTSESREGEMEGCDGVREREMGGTEVMNGVREGGDEWREGER